MANDWRQAILADFPPEPERRLTLAADPDGLLFDEQLGTALQKRGYDRVAFNDAIEFRFVYETRYRAHWEQGEPAPNVVLHSLDESLHHLPYDLLATGRTVHLDLGKLFPELSYPVVATLDPVHLSALYTAQAEFPPRRLGENATRDYILRHVFELDHEHARSPAALLRLLLRRHIRSTMVPAELDRRLVEVLQSRPEFGEWPLERLVLDREVFLAFLQERWPYYLEETKPGLGIAESHPTYERASLPGPISLPFGHEDVRVYIDSLFLEGQLQPIQVSNPDGITQPWMRVGTYYDLQAERVERLRRLLKTVKDELPNVTAHHSAWQQLAQRWAEIRRLVADAEAQLSEPEHKQVTETQKRVDESFLAWVRDRYASLVHLPPTPPSMLHHVPRWLSRRMQEERHQRMALIVIDGLALDQWLVVRNYLRSVRKTWVMREQVVFAWLPTLTAVSRQALFAGQLPLYFANNIEGTDREPKHWERFWVGEGLERRQVGYRKGLGDEEPAVALGSLLGGNNRVIGLVVDKVDRVMHGMELGNAGMHNQIRQWLHTGFFEGLLDLLHAEGYRVFLTSDHGNVEVEGVGQPAEGAVADYRGERTRIFPEPALRERVHARFSDSEPWPAIGLPESFLPLFAPPRKAFIRRGERVVAHGGPSLEELIVPLVEIDSGGVGDG